MESSAARAFEPESAHAETLIDEVRRGIQVEPEVLSGARERRDSVREIAEDYFGALRTYNSGSIAHGTAKNPLPDADAGLVLDRRAYPRLGPDGAGVGPNKLIIDFAAFLQDEVVKRYPNASVEVTKRAIKVDFHEPIDDEDPSVDLIVALTRRDSPGLWIPNTDSNTWNASDPEKHTELLTAEPKDLRVFRARLIRLAKVAIGQDDPPAIISFNVEALALRYVVTTTGLAVGLRDLLHAAAKDIASGLTPDPAGVSPPIKLPEGMTHARASQRLGFFADSLDEAIAADNQTAARVALAVVFPDQLATDAAEGGSGFADALKRGGNTAPAVTLALGPGADRLKPTRAYGDVRR